MKYINTVNEFNRTIGFRYSKPSLKYHAVLFCIGELDNKSFEDLLNFIEVPFEELKIFKEKTTIDLEGHEIETDLIIEFNFFVYSEQEIEKIIEEVRLGLTREFEVHAIDFLTKQAPMLKR